MATEPDYYIVTFDTDRGPFPWAWELMRRSKPMGVRIREKGYQSQTAAEYAGKRALEDFLRALALEERRSRRRADNAHYAPVRPAGQSIGSRSRTGSITLSIGCRKFIATKDWTRSAMVS